MPMRLGSRGAICDQTNELSYSLGTVTSLLQRHTIVGLLSLSLSFFFSFCLALASMHCMRDEIWYDAWRAPGVDMSDQR